MFFKSKKAVVRRNRKIEGDICGHGDLNLQGEVAGKIHVDQLLVGAAGVVCGDVLAQTVRIFGKVKGAVTARHIIIEPGAVVEGELNYESLTVAPNAELIAKFAPRPLVSLMDNRMPVFKALQGMVQQAA